MEPTTAVGVVASASNALVTLVKVGFHYVEIPEEVEQFRYAIENLENSITTAKRLRRVKSDLLDKATKHEVDNTIDRSENVLNNISRTIEGCRVDLLTKGTITVKNKLVWMLRGHPTFTARGVTLNSCIQMLSIHIARMDIAQLSSTITSSSGPLDSHSISPPLDQYLRAPSVRKRCSQMSSVSSQDLRTQFYNTSASLSGLTLSSEKEVVMETQTPMSSNADNISVFSFETESLSARISSVADVSCEGDYCTNEFCTNHNHPGGNNPLVPTQSLDSNIRTEQNWAKPRTMSGTTIGLNPTRPSQRLRHRSGLV